MLFRSSFAWSALAALGILIQLRASAVDAEPAPSEPLETGLIGKRLVAATSRRAVNGGSAFQAAGEIPVGRLSARRADGSAAEKEAVLGMRDLDVSTCIDGLTARTTVKHVFLNETDALLEGVFSFALPADAAVDRFAMTIQSESDLMEGTLVEQNRARSIYTELVYGRAIDPGLLEWTSTRTFRATIFPIPPHGTKTIVVSYLESLNPCASSKNFRQTTYRFPLAAADQGVRKSAPALRTRLRAEVNGLPDGAKLTTSLDARILLNGRNALVEKVLERGEVPDGDWVLDVHAPAPQDLECVFRAYRTNSARPGTFAVTLTPACEVPVRAAPIDLLFLVDTSASRTTAQHIQGIAMIEAVLKTLGPQDRFGIIAFDLTPRALPGGWRKSSGEAIGEAVEFLRRIRPLGATDVVSALDAAAKWYGDAARANTNLIFIGDGEATYGQRSQEALERATKGALQALQAELYCIWQEGQKTGKIPAWTLASGCPVLKLGSEFLPAEGGRMLASRLGAPVLKHARMEVRTEAGETLCLAPGLIGGLPANFPVTLFGTYATAGNATVKLSGELGGRPYAREWKILLPEREMANAGLDKLEARARLGELAFNGEAHAATQLALERGILGPGTAFLVLESEKMYQDYQIRRDPANQPDANSLRAKFLAAAPSIQLAPEGRAAAAPAELRVRFEGAGRSQISAPVDIGGVVVQASLQKAEVLPKQGRLVLSHAQQVERRLALSRLIASARGLPFEPETVFPKLWLEALPATLQNTDALVNQLGMGADDRVWTSVAAQSTQAPGWRTASNASSLFGSGGGTVLSDGNSTTGPATERQIDMLMSPQRPSSILISKNKKQVHLDSHLLAHQLFGALVLGRSPEHWKGANGGNSETLRIAVTRLSKDYFLEQLPPVRLAAAWNFLAQLALAEGQSKLASTLAEHALEAVRTTAVVDAASSARAGNLALGLARQLQGDATKASECYRCMLEGSRMPSGANQDQVYEALLNSMVATGNLKGAIAVMEHWCRKEFERAEVSDQLGRAYLADQRREEAMRAFSTCVEIIPLLAEKYDRPEAFLNRAKR